MNRKWPIKIHKGYWFYPVTDFVYDKAYAEKYKVYENTNMGKSLLEVRLDTLKEYDRILDVGVGSGQLINNKSKSKGFDVNPYMIKKLKKKKQWCDPYTYKLDKFDAICFFDSFEHICYPEKILNLQKYNMGLYLIENIVKKELLGNILFKNDNGAVVVINFKNQENKNN